MLIITQTGRILYISENAAEYLGHSMVGKYWISEKKSWWQNISGGSVDSRRQYLRYSWQAGSSNSTRSSERQGGAHLSQWELTKEHQEQKANLPVSHQRVSQRPAPDEVRGSESDPGPRPFLLGAPALLPGRAGMNNMEITKYYWCCNDTRCSWRGAHRSRCLRTGRLWCRAPPTCSPPCTVSTWRS